MMFTPRSPLTNRPWSRRLARPATPALAVALSAGLLAVATEAVAQNLQNAIDQASPGDTVLVAPGSYSRAVTVDKAITLLAEEPGNARLAGLTGSLATVIGVIFDGSLNPVPTLLVSAGTGLTLEDCTFSGLRAVQIVTGAEDVVLRRCSFDTVLEAVSLDPGVVSAFIDDSDFTDCTLGVIGTGSLTCPGGPERTAAQRCQGSCGRIEITGCVFTRGDRQVDLAGDYVLVIQNTGLSMAATFAVRAAGVWLEMSNCEVNSAGGVGTGLDLDSVSGFIHSSQIVAWDVGITVGDGGCHLYSDLEIGGNLPIADDISNQTWNLKLDQPEPVSAEFNFWGTLDCMAVNAKISGQNVALITNFTHLGVVECNTPVEPTTWGRLKTRFRATGGP